METENLIAVAQICSMHHIELSFIESLSEYDLVEVKTINEEQYILKNRLGEIETMIRMHRDLDINIEGIDAISHLLRRVEDLQETLRRIKNRLKIYE